VSGRLQGEEVKRYSLSLTLIAGLLVAIPPSANAETRTFPCGTSGGTYSVSMPEGVAFKAYRCSGSLTIDNSVKIIENEAFADHFLTSVIIPNSVTSIGDKAFIDTTIASVTIGNSVTSIGALAFAGAPLTSVTIPNSVTNIGERAFVATGLTSITFGNSVTSIGALAFADTQITAVTIPNSMTSIGERAFSSFPLTSVTIPSSVTSIGARAFAETRLTSVTIPDSVTAIESGAFASIPTLASISLPVNLKFLGINVFEENRSLVKIEYCGKLTGVPITPVCPSKAAAKTGASKKTTITCIKGKLTKKVTAVKPLCPAGYKKK